MASKKMKSILLQGDDDEDEYDAGSKEAPEGYIPYTMVFVFPIDQSSELEQRSAKEAQFQNMDPSVRAERLKATILEEKGQDHPLARELAQASTLQEARHAAVKILGWFTRNKVGFEDEDAGDDWVPDYITTAKNRILGQKEDTQEANSGKHSSSAEELPTDNEPDDNVPDDNEPDDKLSHKEGGDDGEKPFDILAFTSIDGDELFFCVRMELQQALQVAFRTQYQLQLSEKAIKHLDIALAPDQPVVPAYVMYNHKYLECLIYDEKQDEVLDFLKQHETVAGDKSPLHGIDHIRLLNDLIHSNIDINQWLEMGILKVAMRSHSYHELAELEQRWASFKKIFTHQPIDLVRNYFGEEIAFYFAFVEFCYKGLLPVVFIAIIIQVYEYYTKTLSDDGCDLLYAIVIAVWSTLFVDFWKRRQTRLANRWGMEADNHSSVQMQINPYFKGVKVPSVGNANVMVLESPWQASFLGRVRSSFFTVLFTMVVVCAAYGNLCAHGHFVASRQPVAAKVTNIALSVQIKVVDMTWSKITTYLTKMENLKYTKDFALSRSVKLISVRIANTFAAFFYLAFAQEFVEGCPIIDGEDSCQKALKDSVLTVYVTSVFFSLMDIVVPLLTYHREKRQEAKAYEKANNKKAPELSLLEAQGKFPEYDGSDLSDDYAQIVFPLLFVMFFGIAFPVASILVPVLCIVQLRCDAWKLVHTFQRPYPNMVMNIGPWRLKLLEAASYMAVNVNWGLVVFRLQLLPGFDVSSKFVAFFVGQQLSLMLMYAVRRMIPEEPSDVLLHRLKHKVQNERIFWQEATPPALEPVSMHKHVLVRTSRTGDDEARKLLSDRPVTFPTLEQSSTYFEPTFV